MATVDPAGQPVIGIIPTADPVALAQAAEQMRQQAAAAEAQAAAAEKAAADAKSQADAAAKAAQPVDPVQVATDTASIANTIMDAITNPKAAQQDAILAGGQFASVAAELQFIPDSTAKVLAAAATIIVPVVFRALSVIRAGHRTQIHSAVIAATGTAPTLTVVQGGKAS